MIRAERTWCALRKGKADLVEGHDSVEAQLVISLLHCEPVAVLNGAITKGYANSLSEVDGLHADNDFVDENRVQSFESVGILRIV